MAVSLPSNSESPKPINSWAFNQLVDEKRRRKKKTVGNILVRIKDNLKVLKNQLVYSY